MSPQFSARSRLIFAAAFLIWIGVALVLQSWAPWRWFAPRSGNFRITKHWQQWGTLRIGRGADRNPLKFDGRALPIGIGTHAKSLIVVDLLDTGAFVQGSCGLNDVAELKGSIVCSIWDDGREVFRTQRLDGTNRSEKFKVPYPGSGELKLIIDNGGDDNRFDHAAWFDLEIVKNGANL